MSKNRKRSYGKMKAIADRLILELSPHCERIEIAGSLRRKKAQIGDIEIIAIPSPYLDLFGEPTGETEVDGWILIKGIRTTKNGAKYKQFRFKGANVDLFLQPDPATWGINMMIRTGSADFSRWMVTPKSQGGAMPDNLHVRNARLWRGSVALETPNEDDVFDWYGMDFIEPEKRER